jgi:hypothetical protein
MAEGPTKTRPEDQPLPVVGRECVQDRLIKLIADRKDLGIKRYGSPLMTHNGRDGVRDALEEAIDLSAYLMQVDLEVRDLRAELEAAKAKLEAYENFDPAGLRDQVATALETRVKDSVLPDPTPAYGGAIGIHHFVGASFFDLADVALAVPALKATLARAYAYENAVTWEVGCAGCARLLDSSIADHDRAEQAEARATELEAGHGRTLGDVIALGRGALGEGDRVGMPEYTPTLRWFLDIYLPYHWPASPVDHRTYVNGDDGYKWLTCGLCETSMIEVDAGTHLTEMHAADRDHTCPPPTDCGEDRTPSGPAMTFSDWRERARARVGDQVAARFAELMAEPTLSAGEFDAAMARNKAEAEAHLDRQSRGEED